MRGSLGVHWGSHERYMRDAQGLIGVIHEEGSLRDN